MSRHANPKLFEASGEYTDITLRDLLAGMAMLGFLAGGRYEQYLKEDVDVKLVRRYVACNAFAQADAMIEARKAMRRMM